MYNTKAILDKRNIDTQIIEKFRNFNKKSF